VGISVAFDRDTVGAVMGTFRAFKKHVQQTDYTTLLAGVGSILLTFLAGAEIDPVSLRRHWKASLSIGAASFALPLRGVFATRGSSWTGICTRRDCRIALSTTSVAVSMPNGRDRINDTTVRQLDPGSACFVTDLGTVLRWRTFANYGWFAVGFAPLPRSFVFLPGILRGR